MEIRPVQPADTPAARPGPAAQGPAPPQDRVSLGEAREAGLRRIFERGDQRPAAVLWSRPIDDLQQDPEREPSNPYRFLPPRPVASPDGRVYVGTNRGLLHAFSPEGEPLWTFDLGRPSANNDPVVSPRDGSLLLTNERDGRVLRLSPEGRVLADGRLPEPVITRLEEDSTGRVYAGGLQAVYGMNADGTLAWSFPNEKKFVHVATRCDDTVLTLHVSDVYGAPPSLVSLDGDGRVLWRYDYQGAARAMPATGPGGETVLGEERTVRSLDRQGREVFSWTAPGDVVELMVHPGGDVFASSEDGTLARLAPDGTVRWTTPLTAGLRRPLWLGPGDEILGVGRDKRLACVSPDGKVLWSRKLDGDFGPFLRVAPDGTSYVQTDLGRVEVFDPKGLPAGTLILDQATVPDHPTPSGRLAVTDFDKVRLIRPLTLTEDPRPPEPPPPPAGDIRRVGDWIEVGGVRLPVRTGDR